MVRLTAIGSPDSLERPSIRKIKDQAKDAAHKKPHNDREQQKPQIGPPPGTPNPWKQNFANQIHGRATNMVSAHKGDVGFL
jgi:hypothetical protein